MVYFLGIRNFSASFPAYQAFTSMIAYMSTNNTRFSQPEVEWLNLEGHFSININLESNI